MVSSGKPGRKPKRTYVRVARQGSAEPGDLPGGRETTRFLEGLDRADRLVAHGELTEPRGDLLVFRARQYDEAERVLRSDPWAKVEGARSELFEWAPKTLGSGVNLDLPPARGSGRLTLLQRVAVVVTDQARATQFYHEGLGLEIRARDAETGYVELSLGKGAASLSLVAPHPEWGEPYFSEAMARVGTRTGIAFQTDSVPALELRLRHLGARVTQPCSEEPWGGRTLRFTDPDGNEFLAFDTGSPSPPRRRGPKPRA